MPIHDWTRVDSGLFHAFHHGWIEELARALNRGVLPSDYFALPEQNSLTKRAEADSYVQKASRLTVRHRHGQVIAVVEIISPGNKGSQAEFRALVEESSELIRQGIHLLVIDLFPPGKRDPQGIHKAIWDRFHEEDLQLPSDKSLTLASYCAGPDFVAYVEFVDVGNELPDKPLFLTPEAYVPTPLEATYQAAWGVFPDALKHLLDRNE